MSRNVNFEGFSSEQLLFMIALADPDDHRTQKEIASDIGVRPETLSRWKQEPGFGERVWELTARSLQSEVSRVSKALLEGALKGNIRHMRLLFEVVGVIGAQRKQSACAREHVLNDHELIEGMRQRLTERELDRLCEESRQKYGIPHPEMIGWDIEGLWNCDYVWVDEAVRVSIV